MSFGKYEGCELDEIPPSYLRWVLENCHDIAWRLRQAIREELGEGSQHRGYAPPPPPPVGLIEQIIRTWHRRMVMKYHPDRGGSHEQMLVVNESAEVLRELANQLGAAK